MTSFVFNEIIVWITVFLLVAAIPLTLVYFRYLNKQKSDSIISKLHSRQRPRAVLPAKSEVNFNFDNNWSAEYSSNDYTVNVGTEKKLAKIILKAVALNGESGMMIKQIADILELHEIEVNYSVNYLTEKGFIECTNTQKGNIFYLTTRGTAYCTKKGYLSEVA